MSADRPAREPGDGGGPDETADAILAAVGGTGNVVTVGHCFVRLRLRLRDDSAADLAVLEALPAVAVALWQAGELHVAPRRGLFEVHDALTRRLGR